MGVWAASLWTVGTCALCLVPEGSKRARGGEGVAAERKRGRNVAQDSAHITH